MNYISDISSLYEEIMLLEFSDAAIRKLAAKFSGDASEEDVRRELADFEKYKAKIEKKDPFQYKTWIELTEVIHAAKAASEQKKDFKKANVEGVANANDIVADDENVTIYRGDSQDKCVLYGRGYTFCISRPAGGNMFSNYRLGKESTFFFIFFKKKSPQENDHIMVLDHTKHGYEWTFKNNSTQRVEGGWDEIVASYPELARYKDLLSNKKLTEEERVFAQRLQEFSERPSLEEFKEFTYKEQAQALKSIINLPDEIWDVLDSTLRNEFISIGPNLTEHQADDLKPNEVARYKKTRLLSAPQMSREFRINKLDFDVLDQIEFDDNHSDFIKHMLSSLLSKLIRLNDYYFKDDVKHYIKICLNKIPENIEDIETKTLNIKLTEKYIIIDNTDSEQIWDYAIEKSLYFLDYNLNIIQNQIKKQHYKLKNFSNYLDGYTTITSYYNNHSKIIATSIKYSRNDYADFYDKNDKKMYTVYDDGEIVNYDDDEFYDRYGKRFTKFVENNTTHPNQNSKREILLETTIKENTSRILTNFDQLFERVCFLKDL